MLLTAPLLIIALVVLSLVLIKSADLIILAIRHINTATHTGTFVISAFLLAIGTSLPELFVAITSALEGTPNLSFGNILGANIANISLVAGASALFCGAVKVQGEYIKKDLFLAFIAGFLPLILAIDGNISRVEGLILLATYGIYVTNLFQQRYLEVAKEHQKITFFYRFVRQFEHKESHFRKDLGRLFLGVALLLVSADLIVKSAIALAASINIPVFLVGLIVLSIGTTLPELAFSIRSIRDHQPTMFYGNLLGSIIANSTLMIGLAATISPIKVVAINESIIASIAFLIIFSTFWFFTRTKYRLDRWEAGILLLLYVVFVILVFL